MCEAFSSGDVSALSMRVAAVGNRVLCGFLSRFQFTSLQYKEAIRELCGICPSSCSLRHGCHPGQLTLRLVSVDAAATPAANVVALSTRKTVAVSVRTVVMRRVTLSTSVKA